MRRAKIQVGDVFQVPLNEQLTAYGQVVGTYLTAYYYAFFESTSAPEDVVLPEAVVKSEVTLLGLSLDAALFHERWRIIGNAPVSPAVHLPAYKVVVGTPNNVVIEDYSAKRTRPATQREMESLTHRTIVSSAVLENALRATHGLEPWIEAFDHLKPNEERAAVRFFPPE